MRTAATGKTSVGASCCQQHVLLGLDVPKPLLSLMPGLCRFWWADSRHSATSAQWSCWWTVDYCLLLWQAWIRLDIMLRDLRDLVKWNCGSYEPGMHLPFSKLLRNHGYLVCWFNIMTMVEFYIVDHQPFVVTKWNPFVVAANALTEQCLSICGLSAFPAHKTRSTRSVRWKPLLWAKLHRISGIDLQVW